MEKEPSNNENNEGRKLGFQEFENMPEIEEDIGELWRATIEKTGLQMSLDIND